MNHPLNLDLLSQCSLCKKELKRQDITLIYKEGGKTIFHATCPRCQTNGVVMLTENSKGIVGMGMVTDLDKTEVAEKFIGKAISSDEVIDAYQFLSKEEGVDCIMPGKK